MAKFQLPDRKQPGDPIRASDYNLLVEAIERLTINPALCGGLDVSQGHGGTVLRVRWKTDRYQGIVQSPGITARSGATPGSGTVHYTTYDPTNGISDTGIAESVLNFSSASGGIATGKYCWFQQDVNGFWWVVSAEC